MRFIVSREVAFRKDMELLYSQLGKLLNDNNNVSEVLLCEASYFKTTFFPF